MTILVCLVGVLVVVELVNLYFNKPTFSAEDGEYWVCEFCGTEIHCTTIEGFVEGLRIHEVAIYCPGDDDDDEEYYERVNV